MIRTRFILGGLIALAVCLAHIHRAEAVSVVHRDTVMLDQLAHDYDVITAQLDEAQTRAELLASRPDATLAPEFLAPAVASVDACSSVNVDTPEGRCRPGESASPVKQLHDVGEALPVRPSRHKARAALRPIDFRRDVMTAYMARWTSTLVTDDPLPPLNPMLCQYGLSYTPRASMLAPITAV